MNATSIQPSLNFNLICSLALVWNLIGVVAYLGQTFMGQQTLLSLSKSEQYYFSNMPAWVTAVFATAVFSGVFGSIAMLLKKRSQSYSTLFQSSLYWHNKFITS